MVGTLDWNSIKISEGMFGGTELIIETPEIREGDLERISDVDGVDSCRVKSGDLVIGVDFDEFRDEGDA